MRHLLVHVERLTMVGLVVALEVAVDKGVVVRPLATLVLVHTHHLAQLRRAEGPDEGRVVEHKHDGKRHTAAPRRDSNAVRQLVGKLDPVAVEPSTGDDEDAVVVRHRRLREDAGEQRADVASEGVDGEDVHHIVDAHGALEHGGKVGHGGGDDADEHRGGQTDKAGSRGDGDQTGNRTGAESDDGPLALQTEVEEHPGETGGGGGEVGGADGHGGADVGGKGGAAVEADPSDPEEDGAEHNVRDVVRLEQQTLCAVSVTRAEVVGNDESGDSRVDLDGSTAGVVEDAPLESPAGGVPDPAGNHVVHERGPDECEYEERPDTAALACGADGDGRHEVGKHALVDRVDDLGHLVVGLGHGIFEHAHVAKVAQIAEERARGLGEGERVAPEEPLERDDGEGGKREQQQVQRVLPARQTRVEVAETGDHDPHERRAGEHPRDVTGRVRDDARAVGTVRDDNVGAVGCKVGRARRGAVGRREHAVCDVDHGWRFLEGERGSRGSNGWMMDGGREVEEVRWKGSARRSVDKRRSTYKAGQACLDSTPEPSAMHSHSRRRSGRQGPKIHRLQDAVPPLRDSRCAPNGSGISLALSVGAKEWISVSAWSRELVLRWRCAALPNAGECGTVGELLPNCKLPKPLRQREPSFSGNPTHSQSRLCPFFGSKQATTTTSEADAEKKEEEIAAKAARTPLSTCPPATVAGLEDVAAGRSWLSLMPWIAKPLQPIAFAHLGSLSTTDPFQASPGARPWQLLTGSGGSKEARVFRAILWSWQLFLIYEPNSWSRSER
ncbi:hypothetical protein L1887_53929 [Cichorium endivia]|nr:hypothetical protein L1887_53929 [Cichorium endivia]